jgi:hypothetical protein
MAFRHATLPAVLSWADKPMMIGKLLEHIPNSLPMLHLLYRLYGRTPKKVQSFYVSFLRGNQVIVDHDGVL